MSDGPSLTVVSYDASAGRIGGDFLTTDPVVVGNWAEHLTQRFAHVAAWPSHDPQHPALGETNDDGIWKYRYSTLLFVLFL